MKANEAPEKLYLSSTGKLSDGISTGRLRDTDIEYTRTDAFIEKAKEWLIKNQKGFILTDKDITDFINYIKGE